MKTKGNFNLRSGMAWAALAMLLSFCLTGCGARSMPIRIDSTPPGAKIFYNDHYIGLTPLLSEIKQRKGDFNVYSFAAEKEGWLPAQKTFKEEFYKQTVADVVPPQLHFELHQIQKYTVLFTSEPAGAVVSIDGKVIGATPFSSTFQEHIGAPSTANFIIQLDGYMTKKAVATEGVRKYDGCSVFVFPEEFHFNLDPVATRNAPPEPGNGGVTNPGDGGQM